MLSPAAPCTRQTKVKNKLDLRIALLHAVFSYLCLVTTGYPRATPVKQRIYGAKSETWNDPQRTIRLVIPTRGVGVPRGHRRSNRQGINRENLLFLPGRRCLRSGRTRDPTGRNNERRSLYRVGYRSENQGRPYCYRSEEHTSELQSLMRITY